MPRRRHRSRCTPRGRCRASRRCRSRARRGSGGCSPPDTPRRTSCPSCRCRARQSHRPLDGGLPVFELREGRILGGSPPLASCCVLLLTGATGTIGLPVLRRLTAAEVPVRCLVRDPRRLGAERVRVQIALGDLADPLSFRHALRGVDTVVHLASVIRDQPTGSIEELAGVATWRLVRAAERAGVQRFVFFSALGASTRSPARLMRAKAVAERAVLESSLQYTVFAPSMVYSPSDPFLTLLERMSLLPVMLISGSGRAPVQPMWAEDVADCVLAALPQGPRGEDAIRRR